MTSFVLNNVHIIDPSRDLNEIGTIIVENGIIIASGSNAINQGHPESAKVRDCKHLIAIPGIIDARVNISGPPEKYSENIAAASKEAAAGGITSLIMMPFIYSFLDEYTFMKFAFKDIKQNSLINIYPTASLTCKMEGKKINELHLLKEQGANHFTHGPLSIYDTQLLYNSMKYAHMLNSIVALDIHDYFIGSNGTMNDGMIASWLGLPCIPDISETIPLARDLLIAQHVGGRYHASAVSIPKSVSILNQARENNVNATCGISINNIILNENDAEMYNTFRKVLPPLRSEKDRIDMIDALAKGNIDIIVSDHTPRQDDTKKLPFSEASFGSIGLKTMLSAALRLFHEKQISLNKLIKSMSTNPAQIFNIPGGTLKPGEKADITLIDLNHQWIAKLDNDISCYSNMAFENESFSGRVVATYVSGNLVYSLES
ncbi:amidohydrolase family protein [Candidatus Liberibacter americanus]|uniref:Dihydroorotase n=1 Tax=Candidatus Liberibacter americanus str. Sao Paulo TaxID=1261131 RepID=U6B577_9HYPH|nr:amidohydrolase family protein [Candidatus Liberibacter americanus]AHA27748.1 Dihydroorotase [Candidatus Liberibacter americanus str. Sao Paulo]EMS36133.1 dihydroorotase [Candidatus Liberibacter americanus PW_SP]